MTLLTSKRRGWYIGGNGFAAAFFALLLALLDPLANLLHHRQQIT